MLSFLSTLLTGLLLLALTPLTVAATLRPISISNSHFLQLSQHQTPLASSEIEITPESQTILLDDCIHTLIVSANALHSKLSTITSPDIPLNLHVTSEIRLRLSQLNLQLSLTTHEIAYTPPTWTAAESNTIFSSANTLGHALSAVLISVTQYAVQLSNTQAVSMRDLQDLREEVETLGRDLAERMASPYCVIMPMVVKEVGQGFNGAIGGLKAQRWKMYEGLRKEQDEKERLKWLASL